MAGILDAILRGLGGEARSQVKSADGQQKITQPSTTTCSNTSKHVLNTSNETMQSNQGPASPVRASSTIPFEIETTDVPSIMTPVRVISSSSRITHSTPRDSSAEAANVSSLSAVELSFGPQPIPFVYNRDGHLKNIQSQPSVLVGSGPIRSAALTPRQPETEMQIPHQSLEEGEIGQHSDSEAEHPVSPKQELSSWRKAQLRYRKTPSLIPGTVLRPIATLHGPSNLPYARNPSGIDATIQDDSVLSHVWAQALQVQTRSRDFRSTPVELMPSRESAQVRQTARPVNVSANVGHAQQSVTPEIVADFVPQSSAKASRSVTHSPARSELTNSVKSTQSAPVPPASAILRAQLAPPAPPRLEPIPGSPSKETPGSASASTPVTKSGADANKENIPPPKTGSQSIQRTSPLGPVEGTNFGNTQRIPSNETTQSHQSGGSGGTHSTSRTSMSVPVTPGQIGKADRSDNWRDRVPELEPLGPSIVVTTPNKSQTPVHALESSSTQGVMTIDSLFERYSGKSSDSAPIVTFKPPTPSKASSRESTALPLPMTPLISTPPPRAPLGESSDNQANTETENISRSLSRKQTEPSNDRSPTLAKAEASSTRGTPNAGRLLKKGKDAGTNDKAQGSEMSRTSKDRVSARSKGKGRVKAAPATGAALNST
ncbi:hypothetical protein BD324DRAFT_647526 [Kockovaella imperatae]|uniref:Uncharacterized protein n=1 Tax=Kockovaella imperatae TaxID=4999 RepID=A0A1Y1URA1_9TREE|nr:hypothetical protein BD324DRAFT_647526 [Kockovaella imperatae]ORX40603.1 hypothetical protein BD324DRAFT_647526 [Kockovaella imperatae]